MLATLQSKMAADDEKKNTGNEFIDKLNVKNAKIIAICLVIGFSIFHGIRHIKYGVNSCSLLMNDGRYNKKQEWQPYGCMMHNYSEIDTKRCSKLVHFITSRYNQITFIGDSRLFHLYGAFLKTINNKISFKHNRTQYYLENRLGLRVQYLHVPCLNDHLKGNISHWSYDKTPPSLVIFGFGLESFLNPNGSLVSLQQFKETLTKFVPTIDALVRRGVKVLWALQEPINIFKRKSWKGFLNNSVIDLFNNAAIEILQVSKAEIFISHRKLSTPFLEDMKDGLNLHSDHIAKKAGAQVLLNVYCNDHMNFQDGSCCTDAEQYTTLQVVTFAVLFSCFLLAVVAVIHEKHSKWRRKFTISKPSQVQSEFATISYALAKLALIMGYFYICDRTNFFMKETKYFSHSAFWIPAVYLLCVGLFFTEHSRYSKVLHRDQINEWRGWMQIVILIYHWTDAEEMLPLFMLGKVLVSAYIFLTGYQHFFYFWQSGDGSFVRFFRVLFRLNFMQFVVCLCMNRPYQSYEFIPLISFWFIMVYLFLVLPPRITALSSESHPIQYLYLVLKYVCFFGIITTLYMSEVFFEKIFVTRPWKALFVTADDDISLWWRGWKRERYGALCGMVFAAALLIAQRFNLLDDNNHNNLFSNGISLSATLVSLIGIASYTAFVFLCRDVAECIEIHSYAAFIPIISYIVLRNISGVLRTRYSTFFAWFGKISLELFVGQFHIWLAADLNGILVLAPKYNNLNVFLTSFIFTCAAHEVHEITDTLMPYAVPTNLYSLARNVLLFIAALVPIGIHAGMF